MIVEGNNKDTIQIVLSECKAQNRPHYVYVLSRQNGEPFYVGKGQNTRVFEHEVEAIGTSKRSHKLSIIRSIIEQGGTVKYSIHEAFSCHDYALKEERNLIQNIGRFDLGTGPLTNQTDGGEGTLNPSEESKEKHRQTLSGLDADDPDVVAANRFLAEFCKVDSNPIKSVKKYGSSISTLHINNKPPGKTIRTSGALVAMTVAQSVMLTQGAELSRRFCVDGVDMILENGCGRRMLTSGMIELVDNTPKHERIKITQSGIDYILQSYERHKLISYGILEE